MGFIKQLLKSLASCFGADKERFANEVAPEEQPANERVDIQPTKSFDFQPRKTWTTDGKTLAASTWIRGDGNCFFRCWAELVYGSEGEYPRVRREACEYIREHPGDFKEEVEFEAKSGGFTFGNTVEAYVERMSCDRVSGDDVTIRALQHRYQRRMVVYQRGRSSSAGQTGGMTHTALFDYTYPEEWPLVHMWFAPPWSYENDKKSPGGHYELVLMRDLGTWVIPENALDPTKPRGVPHHSATNHTGDEVAAAMGREWYNSPALRLQRAVMRRGG